MSFYLTNIFDALAFVMNMFSKNAIFKLEVMVSNAISST